jgi:hypothetical protein
MVTVVSAEPAVLDEESDDSAVSWGAIAAGAVASAAFTLFLLQLLAGLGLSAVSPWANSGASSTSVKIGGAVAIILIAVLASALGGYLAGRLRTKWVGLHTDEVYFRDTAHGLLAWAFATLLSASVLAGATAVVTGAASSLAGGAAQGAASNPNVGSDRNSYYVDSLFRSDKPAAPGDASASNAEAGRLFARAVTPGGTFSDADRTYLAQVIASRTGISQADAEKRVNDTITQAKTAADDARRAAAKLALLMAGALLAGALAAALAAAEGGRERDA